VNTFRIKCAFRAVFRGMAIAFLLGQPGPSHAAGLPYERVFKNRNATGEELARAFFDLLSKTGSPAGTIGTTPAQDEASKKLVRPYLDPAFLLQRASGERYTAQTYLPADVDEFKLGDVSETRPAEGVVVVRYAIRTFETLPDSALVMSKDKAPRLTVFHWSVDDKRWKVLSHANFNTPVAAICDRKPFFDNGVNSPAHPKDQALGEELVGRFYDLVSKGDALPIYHPELQFQSASGVGYSGLVNRARPTRYRKITFGRAVVTRNGRLLVVSSYNSTEERILMQSVHLQAESAPNLSTFMQGQDGTWSLIAIAAFAPAKALPEGAVCMAPGKLQNAP